MDTLPGLPIDSLKAEAFSPLGAMALVLLDAAHLPSVFPPAVLIAVDWQGALPPVDQALLDVLITTRQDAPAP